MGKDDNVEENTVRYSVQNLDSERDELTPNRCRRQDLIWNTKRSKQTGCKELFVPNVRGLVSSIPKHITTFDEKYALRCLELIRNCALRTAAWKFVSRVDALPDDLSNLPKFEIPDSYDVARMTSQCALGTRSEVITNSTRDWVVGTVTHSSSMINILKSPLLRQFGPLDFDVNLGKTSLLEANEPIHNEFSDSPKESVDVLSHKPNKEVAIIDRSYESPPMHKRVVSASSTNSSCSNNSSSSASVSSLQGMLQCTWKNGLPHLVFTVDDKKEVLLAIVSKTESSDGKVTDYAYTFHSRKKGKKERDLNELDFEVVGKMDVSTSITSGFNNPETTVETRFVLYVPGNDPINEQQISNQNPRKHSRLTTKVANVFKSSHSFKRRSSSKFEGSNAIFEDTSWEPAEVINPVESNEVKHKKPNLELAAIIVKDAFKNPKKETDSGGWGLKFLKKLGHDTTAKTTFHSLHSTASDNECSSSLNVLIPAGVHGGQTTRVGGPTSLIERWTSGGKCDCGGWDMGCPLTILSSRLSDMGSSSLGDSSGECKSVNLFTLGSKQDHPVLQMVNIHEGLHYIHFQSTLSFLQSFAIAASILHCRSPILRSKVYRN